MGWKGTMRSLNAAARQAERQAQRHDRAVVREAERDLRRLGQSADRSVKVAYDFERQLVIDPIRTLALHYNEHQGLVSNPFQIQTDAIQGSIYLIHQKAPHPHLVLFESPTCRITLLEFRVAPFGTIAIFRIDNAHPEYRIKLNWLKKSDPRTSPLFLVDDVNNQYYYPKATDLTGEVVPRQSRIGIVVFDTFKMPTTSVQIHFSDVKLGPEKGRSTFQFAHHPPDLWQDISTALATPRLGDQVMAEIQRLTAAQAGAIQRRASNQLARRSSGCLGCVLVLAMPPAILVAGLWLALT